MEESDYKIRDSASKSQFSKVSCRAPVRSSVPFRERPKTQPKKRHTLRDSCRSRGRTSESSSPRSMTSNAVMSQLLTSCKMLSTRYLATNRPSETKLALLVFLEVLSLNFVDLETTSSSTSPPWMMRSTLFSLDLSTKNWTWTA